MCVDDQTTRDGVRPRSDGAGDGRGGDPGLAALYYQLNMDMFWTAMLGWLHTLALARANGITARDLLPYAKLALDVDYFLDFHTDRIGADFHPGDVIDVVAGRS